MNLRRKVFVGAALAVFLLAASPQRARAQWVVFDPANYAQQLMDYVQYLMEVTQELNTYEQAVQQYSSLDGIRNYQQLLSNPIIREFLPSGWQNTLQSFNAQCFSQSGDALVRCLGNTAQQVQNLLSSAQSQIDTRRTDVQSLINQLSGTADAKQTADLQARVDGEIANILTEQADMTAMQLQLQEDQITQTNQVMTDLSGATQLADPLQRLSAPTVQGIAP